MSPKNRLGNLFISFFLNFIITFDTIFNQGATTRPLGSAQRNLNKSLLAAESVSNQEFGNILTSNNSNTTKSHGIHHNQSLSSSSYRNSSLSLSNRNSNDSGSSNGGGGDHELLTDCMLFQTTTKPILTQNELDVLESSSSSSCALNNHNRHHQPHHATIYIPHISNNHSRNLFIKQEPVSDNASIKDDNIVSSLVGGRAEGHNYSDNNTHITAGSSNDHHHNDGIIGTDIEGTLQHGDSGSYSSSSSNKNTCIGGDNNNIRLKNDVKLSSHSLLTFSPNNNFQQNSQSSTSSTANKRYGGIDIFSSGWGTNDNGKSNFQFVYITYINIFYIRFK